METKFIEGTNEQYSIREDGVVISYYRLRHSPLHNQYYVINNIHEMIPNECHAVTIFKKQYNVRKLLFKYFGYVFCRQCNCKSNTYLNAGICKKCVKLNRKNREKRDILQNPDKYKAKRKRCIINNPKGYSEMSKRATQKEMLNLTRHYIASCLSISVKDLSNELYEHHRNLIFLKRKIAKEHNISMNRLK